MFIILYLLGYFIWIYPLHDLSKYRDKKDTIHIIENLTLGLTDPARIKKIKSFESILSWWYSYWYFHTEQYTIWSIFNLKNQFSDQGVVRIYYYDFFTKEFKHVSLDIDFKETKTYLRGDILVVEHHENYIQEIDLKQDTMRIFVNCRDLKLDLMLSMDDYSTQFPALIPRYELLNGAVDFKQTKCPNEWAYDINMIGKIKSGNFNKNSISGGNFWFDSLSCYNNFFLSEYIWINLLNDDWMLYFMFIDKEENLRQNKNVSQSFIIKDRKNNKMLKCGIDTNIVPLYDTLHKMIHPEKIEYTYQSMDHFEIHYEIPNFKLHMTSIPNDISKKTHVVIDDTYKATDIPENLNDWDKKYYEKISDLDYHELVTMVNVNILYNNESIQFTERVVVDGFIASSNKPYVFCESNSIRNHIVQ